jgi:hypothetical protein
LRVRWEWPFEVAAQAPGKRRAESSGKGVLHIRGLVHVLSDMFTVLRLGRRIAGKGRVVNGLELVPIDDEGD